MLLSTGLLANLPLFAVSLLLRRFYPELSPSHVGGVIVLFTCALLDGALAAWGRPKPWATRTQVPQWWGHKFGPWWGSARYGLRLGLGPATILNSWLWWGALLVTIGSPGFLLFGISVFVVVRTLTTLAVSWGVRSGEEMAQRARHLDASAVRVRCGVVVAVLSALLVSLLAR